MEKLMDKLMDGTIASCIAIVDKDGCLHVGLNGNTDTIILCIGCVLMDIAKHKDMTMEEVGEQLNTSVTILQEGDEKHEKRV